MKKKSYLVLVALMTFALLSVFSSCSDDDQVKDESTISYDKLPLESKQFITDHFIDYQVERTLQKASGYSVSLFKSTAKSTAQNRLGYEIEFDRSGIWIEIEGHNDAVLPENVLALLPRSILSYVVDKYPTRGINEIKKETYGYKIELAGDPDVELKFDIDGIYIAKESEGEVVAYDQLPVIVKDFLTAHFSGIDISKVEKDRDGYEVKYANRVEVEFDLLGRWYELDFNGTQMPQSISDLLPKKITDHLIANYPSKKVESVKNKISTYEIELAGDLDLVFDREGNFWSSGGDNGSGDRNRVAFSGLPQSIQSFLTEYFLATTKFLYAEKDNEEYEVKLANGTEVSLYINGELKSVEVLPGQSVPDNLILAPILSYVKNNYSDRKIEEYEKKHQGYKVELSGYPEVELLFDTNGSFKRID